MRGGGDWGIPLHAVRKQGCLARARAAAGRGGQVLCQRVCTYVLYILCVQFCVLVRHKTPCPCAYLSPPSLSARETDHPASLLVKQITALGVVSLCPLLNSPHGRVLAAGDGSEQRLGAFLHAFWEGRLPRGRVRAESWKIRCARSGRQSDPLAAPLGACVFMSVVTTAPVRPRRTCMRPSAPKCGAASKGDHAVCAGTPPIAAVPLGTPRRRPTALSPGWP